MTPEEIIEVLRTMTPAELQNVLQEIFMNARGEQCLEAITHHPGYRAWMVALTNMGESVGITSKPVIGETPTYAKKLIEHGVDPKHSLAVATLIFS